MRKSASLIIGIYVHHLFALAKAVRDGCDQVFRLAPVPEEDGYIKVSPELHATIDGILIDAANLKKLIRTSPERGSSESARTFAFRRIRTEQLSDFLRGLQLDVLLDVKLRNSLEHFDEHLDKLGARLESGERAPQPGAAFNLAFSSWKVVETVAGMTVFPLRVYVADIHTYYNFQHEIDLMRLRGEASEIVDRIETSGAFQEGEPGGLMVVFPPPDAV